MRDLHGESQPCLLFWSSSEENVECSICILGPNVLLEGLSWKVPVEEIKLTGSCVCSTWCGALRV